MSDRNAAIRALIEHRFPDATPVTHRTAEPVATGGGATVVSILLILTL